MITSVRPMTVEHARALAMAYELHRLLGDLYDRPSPDGGPGSCVEDAWNRMDDVIGMLEPEEDAPDEPRNVTYLRRTHNERR
jgi:hypothetical protein